jgi:hypothetical protein
MIFLALILAFAIGWLFYRKTTPQLTPVKRYLLMALRIIVLFIVLLFLLNPIWNYVSKRSNPEKVIILTDNSASIDEKKRNYFSNIKPIVEKKYKQANYNVVNYTFADGLQGSSNKTYLLKTMAELQKQEDLSNTKIILLFSDGWFQDEELEQLQSLQIPIDVYYPNQNLVYEDLSIEEVQHNTKALQDEVNPIVVTAVASHFKGMAEVELQVDGKTVAQKECDFSQKSFDKINFEHAFQETGLKRLTVKISSEKINETNEQNNFYYGAVQVSKRDFKITILSDKLNWDVKFLKDCIKRQENWQYQTIIPEKYPFQLSPENLAKTNVLIIINNGTLKIENLDFVENFLKNGNSLLSIGKPLAAEFSTILGSSFKSARKSSVRISNEADQFTTFQLWRSQQVKIAPLAYYFAKPKAQSQVLAEFNNQQKSPAILFNYFFKGKVLEFLFHDIWQWQMEVENANFHQFFSDILQWLGSSETDRFIAYPSQNSYIQGEEIDIFLQAYDEAYNLIQDLEAKAELFNQDDEKIAQVYMSPQQDRFVANFTSNLEPGHYKFQVSDNRYKLQANGEFIVQKAQLEKFNLGFNRNNLNYVSHISDGSVYHDPKQLSIQKAQIKTQKIEQQIPLYKKWYIIALFLFCFCLELFLRRKWGLL